MKSDYIKPIINVLNVEPIYLLGMSQCTCNRYCPCGGALSGHIYNCGCSKPGDSGHIFYNLENIDDEVAPVKQQNLWDETW